MDTAPNEAYRKNVILGIFGAVVLLFLLRLFQLQLLDEQWDIKARKNALRYVDDFPPRGLIYDRNGQLLVNNTISYDLMVIPRQVKISADKRLELCRILGISDSDYNARMEKARQYSTYAASIFMRQLTEEQHNYMEERMYNFSGFYMQARTTRNYQTHAAAHTLGYIAEVNYNDMEKDAYYKMGDYIGKSGIERSYEAELRGKKGFKIKLVNNLNQEKGAYENGKYDTAAIPGKDLWTTLDKELQEYGERLMQGKRGSIVAIEPSTGEILCLVTSPSYDPALLVGRDRGANYAKLNDDQTEKPLFNRALMAMYPPGSTFKLVQALVGLEEGAVTPASRFPCYAGFPYGGGHKLGCHSHGSPLDMPSAIQTSCNAWFCYDFKAMMENRKKYKTTKEAYDAWRKKVCSFGFGKRFDTDLSYEKSGNIPTSAYYDRYYGEGRWRATTIISISIGQGEIMVTPVQLANLVAVIANKGYYYPPHLVKAIGDRDSLNSRFNTRHTVAVSPQNFEPVIEGMKRACLAGTARSAAVPGFSLGGKTGTAQNPHGKDHSILVCYGPTENPKIAISVIVENAGFGATWAGPIAGLMIEKYLTDTVKRPDLENRIINAVIK
ncbi:MAG: penicillin-binding protein 2 [Bacteroidales bacterium]|nr:penicillin-binding protein 2 [Bacteroidales bacterium]